MKKNKCILTFITLFYFLCLGLCSLPAYNNIEFAFDEDKPERKKPLPIKTQKIKAELVFTENPNKEDFFSRNDLGTAIDLEPLSEIKGNWSGQYDLSEKSIKWINPTFNQSKVFKKVEFGKYLINLNFIFSGSNRLEELNINQDQFDYGHIYFRKLDSQRLIYWTSALSGKWTEVIRGKMVRKSKDEIYTIFQTTVYEEGIPIYAFRGEAILHPAP